MPLAVGNLPLQFEVEDADAVVAAGRELVAVRAEGESADGPTDGAGVTGYFEDFLPGAGVEQPDAVHGARRQGRTGRRERAREDAAPLRDGDGLRTGGDLEHAAGQLARRGGELASVRREVCAQDLTLVPADRQLALQRLGAQDLGSLVCGRGRDLAAIRGERRAVDRFRVDLAALEHLAASDVVQRQRAVRGRRGEHDVSVGRCGREARTLGLFVVAEAVQLLAGGHIGDDDLAIARARCDELAGRRE